MRLSLDLRMFTSGPFIRGKIRRFLNETQTVPYKRHSSSEIRRDLAKNSPQHLSEKKKIEIVWCIFDLAIVVTICPL